MPSRNYELALEQAKEHHAASKTYSGKLMRPHVPHIKRLIEAHDCTNALDYGAGKGKQYDWIMPNSKTVEQEWGIHVTKYDPAWPPFAAEPTGYYDLVICTHTLGTIPLSDMHWVLDKIFSLTRKVLYVAEQIGPVKKDVVESPNALGLPVGWTEEQWKNLLTRETHVVVVLSCLHKLPGARIRKLWRLAEDRQWTLVDADQRKDSPDAD